MADLDITQNHAGNTRIPRAGAAVVSDTQAANTRTIAQMKAWLTANKPASYPPATLSKMTKNDLLYACLVEGLV